MPSPAAAAHTAPAAVAAAAAAGAAWVLFTCRPSRRSLLGPGRHPAGSARRWHPGSTGATVALGLAGLGLVLVLPLHQALLLAVLAQLAAAGVRGARRRRAERDAIARRLRVVEFTEALVGELRAGLPVTVALQRAIDVWPEAAPVASAARWGADVPTALGHLAELPGAGSVGRLGSVWSLCAGSGSSLAVGVGHILETARAEEATRHVVAAELASARATARMLGLMPVLVLVAGQALGAEPWAFLLDTMPGVLCLTVGSGFALAGLAWLDRIADRAVTGVP